jgi:hypothetical protein
MEAGITALEASQAVGVQIKAQFEREAGKVSMALVDLIRYAKLLGCKPEDLLRG